MKLAFDPHKFNKEQFKPLGKHIIVADMTFDERISHAGIILLNDDMKSAGIRPRWAQVYALGPDFEDDDIQIGKWICISHGRWTRGIDIEDETGKKTLRRVDENDILLVSDEPVNDFTMSDKV
jgi:NOL1/NOP2/fmu family ribosome biogenesis protein